MGRFLLFLIAVGILIYTASTSLTQVKSGERAVVRRFGRILDDKPESGLHIGWPWGIDQVTIVHVSKERSIKVGFDSKREQDDEVVPAGQMLTGDHNLVNVQAVIDYRVREADIDKFLLQADNIDALVARASESLLAEWIAGRRVDDVRVNGKIELSRFLRDRLQERLHDYDVGIEIRRASITDLSPPEQVKDAFDRVAQAHTNIDTTLKQAQQESKKRETEASADKYHMEKLARAYARGARINAVAEADGFQRRWIQYRTLSRGNPDYLNVLWLDEMTRLYARMKESGRIELLDHYLTSDGISITQFPLQPRKK